MLPELGQIALIIAFLSAILQGVMPLVGAAKGLPAWRRAAAPLARAQCLFLGAALAFLAAAFYRDDFSVAYVAQNSNTALPVAYRLAAVWGGHEGSLLLWSFLLALWSVAVTFFGGRMPAIMRARIVGVLGLIAAGFLAFALFASNPFARLWPPPAEGRDLNPLLQDPGLIIHPPMLYMGYVGFSVSFAFAVAALLGRRMDSAWAKWARPWALAAWSFLTLGIMLGSWWAYYELGWGGWWFWDPVENASFMPWLLGVALLHSLAATEARGVFKPWTAMLSLLTFALCLLGAFLVRSGVLTSVHAFATDPRRGLFLLILLFVVVAAALLLHARRAADLRGGGDYSPLSRESGVLLNNVLLSAAAFAVFLGTLYPLFLESIGGGKISVGAPYFDRVFAPLAGAAAAVAASGAFLRWKKDSLRRLAGKLAPPAAAALAVAAVAPTLFADGYRPAAAGGLALALWLLLATARAAVDRWRAGTAAGRGFWGMLLAHAGVGVFVAGVSVVNVYGQERDVLLRVGEEHSLAGWRFQLTDIADQRGENYNAVVAEAQIADENGAVIAVVRPEKRRYDARPDSPMTEAGIAVGWGGDWLVSLGEPREDGAAWTARLQHKPFIRLIWGGALLMALGGFVAAADRRYRR